MATYKYRLKSGCTLDPDQVYKVAKSGGASQCSYLWDARGNSPGWIPASENFDWDGSKYVRYSCGAKENAVYTIVENCPGVYAFEEAWAKRKELHNRVAQEKVSSNPAGWDKDLESLLDTNNDLPKGFLYSKGSNPCREILLGNTSFDPAPVEILGYVPTYRSPDSTTIKQTKKETMLDNIIATNKAAAVQAAYLETGRIANATAANLLAKKFPGLPQTPFNALVIANLADVIGKQIKPSPKLAKITTAMVTQAYAEVYQLIDLEGMIGELLSTVPGFDDGE